MIFQSSNGPILLLIWEPEPDLGLDVRYSPRDYDDFLRDFPNPIRTLLDDILMACENPSNQNCTTEFVTDFGSAFEFIDSVLYGRFNRRVSSCTVHAHRGAYCPTVEIIVQPLDP